MTAVTGGAPRATVVIVNWNGERLLPACLDAVAAQTAPFRYETWVVDNASRDGSVALLRERYPWVQVLRSGANKGFAGGNNHALREVSTPYAVLLNNDATPEPDWLANLLAPFDAPGGERLGAVTGKVVFAPTFLRLRLSTAGFVPGAHDGRSLGVRVCSVLVNGEERLGDVLWERSTYGAEGPPTGRFFWTRPAGELLVPVPPAGPVTLAFTWAAERAKPVTLRFDGGSVSLPAGPQAATVPLVVPPDAPRVDVINNVGGIVLVDGYGADRGY
ncbi:MAG TPA: glycosyltransferase family 2 protein, partial [Frankiaceae bacterium]|nr:glycosyltransferase family 2 protein [Frankiaceae bacterium]